MMARLKAQAGFMAGAKRNRTNPFAKNTYATLESVLEAVAEPLCENGLVLTQWCGPIEVRGTKGDQKSMTVYTRFEHAESSEFMQVWISVTLTKDDAQGIGSAMTYGRRYSLKAALGIPEVDDDGAAAAGQDSDLRKPRKSAYAAKKDGGSEVFTKVQNAIRAAISVEHLQSIGDEYRETIDDLPPQWQDMLRDEYASRREDLSAKEAA